MKCLPCIFLRLRIMTSNKCTLIRLLDIRTCRSVCISNKRIKVHLLDVIILNLILNNDNILSFSHRCAECETAESTEIKISMKPSIILNSNRKFGLKTRTKFSDGLTVGNMVYYCY